MSDKMYELEQQILQCWEITDNLKVMATKNDLTKEDLQTIIRGMVILYDLKFDSLFQTYSKLLTEK